MRCENEAIFLDTEDLLKGQTEFQKTLKTRFLFILKTKLDD